jgi:hypothetical protein
MTPSYIFSVVSLATMILACGCAQTRTPVVGTTPDRSASSAQPLLTEAQAVRIANQEAERLKIPVREFKGPVVHRFSRHKWSVFYHRDKTPGDHFSIEVDDRTGATSFQGGL